MIDAAPTVASTAIGHIAAAARGDADVFRAALGSATLTTSRAVAGFAAGGGAATACSTAVGLISRAALTRGLAEGAARGTTKFFAIANAEAAGVVAAFGMGGAHSCRVATVGAAFAGRGRGTGANPIYRRLIAGAADRRGSGGRSPGGVDLTFGERAPNGGGADPEDSLEYRTTALAHGKRLDK